MINRDWKYNEGRCGFKLSQTRISLHLVSVFINKADGGGQLRVHLIGTSFSVHIYSEIHTHVMEVERDNEDNQRTGKQQRPGHMGRKAPQRPQ